MQAWEVSTILLFKGYFLVIVTAKWEPYDWIKEKLEGGKELGLTFNHRLWGDTLSLFEVTKAAEVIQQAVDPEANIIFGVKVDPNMGNDVRLTLIATGFATKESLTMAVRDEKYNRMLRSIKSDEELAVPSFMRQPRVIFGKRNSAAPPSPW